MHGQTFVADRQAYQPMIQTTLSNKLYMLDSGFKMIHRDYVSQSQHVSDSNIKVRTLFPWGIRRPRTSISGCPLTSVWMCIGTPLHTGNGNMF